MGMRLSQKIGRPVVFPTIESEFVYNSSTSTTSDTTSFATGKIGAMHYAFAPSGTNTVLKRVQFSSPILEDDDITLEIQDGTGAWKPYNQRLPSLYTNDAGSAYFGATLINVSSTQLDVAFYSQPLSGVAWASVGAYRWRVRRDRVVSIAIGAGISATSPSLVPRYEEYVDSGVFRAVSQVGADVAGSSYALSATRIGKTVNLRITGGSGTSSAQSQLYCQNVLPASMRPDTLLIGPLTHYSGSTAFRVRVNTTGAIDLAQLSASTFAVATIPNSTILYALTLTYNLT